MKRQTRDRLVLPILLPVGILVVIAGVLYGFSRILLALSANAATATALAVAGSIVVASAVVASRRTVRVSSLVGLVGAVTGVAMIAGGLAVAAVGTEGEEAPGEAGAPGITVVAQNIAFDTDTIELQADTPTTITFENLDAGIQHNIEIYEDDSLAAPLFQGDIITGTETIEYEIPPLPAGEYYFLCIVHPNMNGRVVVSEGPAGGGEAGAPGVTVVAENIAFDTDTIELQADTPTTITLDNRDAGVQHNISIFEDDTLATVLFKGELVTGPTSVEYQIPPLPPGEYYFHCDVHPNMSGTVIVGGGPGGAETPAETPEATGPAPTGPAEGGAVTTEVVAQGIAFDVTEIVLPAGQESTIRLVNNDAGVQHNIAIATDPGLSEQLFNGELITGPSEIEYTIPPLEPGEYYFVCIVHPNMNGTVIVR